MFLIFNRVVIVPFVVVSGCCAFDSHTEKKEQKYVFLYKVPSLWAVQFAAIVFIL